MEVQKGQRKFILIIKYLPLLKMKTQGESFEMIHWVLVLKDIHLVPFYCSILQATIEVDWAQLQGLRFKRRSLLNSREFGRPSLSAPSFE